MVEGQPPPTVLVRFREQQEERRVPRAAATRRSWDIFLSHAQHEAQNQAAHLSGMLVSRLRPNGTSTSTSTSASTSTSTSTSARAYCEEHTEMVARACERVVERHVLLVVHGEVLRAPELRTCSALTWTAVLWNRVGWAANTFLCYQRRKRLRRGEREEGGS